MKDRSKNLKDAYANTKAVAPKGWETKYKERGLMQNEILKLLKGN